MYGYLHALSFTSNTLKSFITILFNFETEKAKYCFYLMIIPNYYAPAYQTDSNICKFINKKWMNQHVIDVHNQSE